MKANKVLVVEDEAFVAFEIMTALRAAGVEVVGPVPNVAAALEVVELDDYDAALLDMNLNGDASFDVAQALRRKAVPFAFVTAYNRMILPDGLRSAPLLTKPFQQSDLVALARELLEIAEEAGS